MNTYHKLMPNVFLAKCTEKYEKGDEILVETRYGKENESIVFNLIFERDGFYYYSIIRADGFNVQERARNKADRLRGYASNAENKSDQYYKQSHDATAGIPFGQPILVGHHSEKRHRRAIEKSRNAADKCVEMSDKAKDYNRRADYWKSKADTINLSMPECLEYYEFLLEKAKAEHEGLKNGTIEKRHSYSLAYAKKTVNEIEKKLNIARKLWA